MVGARAQSPIFGRMIRRGQGEGGWDDSMPEKQNAGKTKSGSVREEEDAAA